LSPSFICIPRIAQSLYGVLEDSFTCRPQQTISWAEISGAGWPATVGLFGEGHWVGGALTGKQFAGVNHQHVDEMTINLFLI
jgi:hypothetical protein